MVRAFSHNLTLLFGAMCLFVLPIAALTTAGTALAAVGEVLSHQKISDTQGGFTGALDNNDQFGYAVAALGDLDCDGVNDVAVQGHGDDDGGTNYGAVWVLFLNSDGTVRSHQKISDTEGNFTGTLDVGDLFGSGLAGLGDLDGDGVNDLAAGAWGDDDGGTNRGAVWVLFLNSDGTVKSHQKISDTLGNFTGTLGDNDFFGYGVKLIGDLDGDGIGELAVGAFGDDDGGVDRGAVWILFLDPDGTVRTHQKISSTQGGFTGALDDSDQFGYGVAALGDFDGDSVEDIAVSALLDDDGGVNPGAIWLLFLNSDGTVKSRQKISATQGGFTGELNNDDRFGLGLCAVGDLDCDGVTDLAAGAYRDDDGGSDYGAVWMLFLNDDGTVKSHQKISQTQGNFTGTLGWDHNFGMWVTSLEDLNGDDVAEIAVGARQDDDGGTNRGAVWVLFLDGVPCTGSTPVGPDIVVVPEDPTTGTTPVTLTFDQVTEAGVTDLSTGSTGAPPPAGFRLGSPPTYYELTTTAQFTGTAEICIDYSALSFGNESKLKLYHREDGNWVDRTVSLDTDADIICAQVTDFSSFAIFELYIGSVAGLASANCPDPNTGLLGVRVDAFADGTGDLVRTAVTDENGNYQIDELATGDYTITVVTPLSYVAAADEIDVTVLGGEVAAADFALSCLDIPASQRSQGFWKHQVGVALGGKGNAQIDAATLCDYLDLIEGHFNSNEVNQVVVYEPPASGECDDKLEVARDLLNLKGKASMTARARQQLMALLLNVASGKLSLTEVISDDGATVSQAITYCDNLIDDAAGDHEKAKDICDWINNAEMVPADVIPLDTDNIAYSPPRDRREPPAIFSLDQNHPNPFNPTTRISFSLDREGVVSLAIYDIAGKVVTRLVDRRMSAGTYSEVWNGRDDRGNAVASGVYFYRLTVDSRTLTRKAVLIR